MHPKYSNVVQLRREGKSYREIASALDVSKSSVSDWCKGLELPLLAQKIINKKIKQNKSVFKFYNKRKHCIVQAENKKIRKESAGQIFPLSEYELLLIRTALYWAEGYKRQDQISSPRVGFVNSDPDMIKVFLCFLKKVLRVPNEKIKVSIRIHPNVSKESAINFWSKITAIPKDRFGITDQISSASQRKRPKNLLPYGTLDVRVNSRQNFYKIKGWIEGLKKYKYKKTR